MSKLKKLALGVGVLVFVVGALILLLNPPPKPYEPRELLAARYYDYSSLSEYVFLLGDTKLNAADVHALSADEYYRFADGPTSFPMYLRWDEDAGTVTIDGESDGSGMTYFLFQSEDGRALVIPKEQRRVLFEQKRPLAFYLVPQDAAP